MIIYDSLFCHWGDIDINTNMHLAIISCVATMCVIYVATDLLLQDNIHAYVYKSICEFKYVHVASYSNWLCILNMLQLATTIKLLIC